MADVSHELRTPLTTIRGNLDLLQHLNTGVDREQKEILADAVSESRRMVRLVQNLLVIARAEAGRHIENVPVQLGEADLAATLAEHDEVMQDAHDRADQIKAFLAAGDMDGLSEHIEAETKQRPGECPGPFIFISLKRSILRSLGSTAHS